MINPLDFAANFLKQPYPTMGLAPSAVNVKTGGTVITDGAGRSPSGVTGQSLWSRIASGIPFGFAAEGILGLAKGTTDAAGFVEKKTNEGAAAVQGKVNSISDSIGGFLSGYSSILKWSIVGAVVVAVVFFLAQIKSLFRS